MGTIQVIEKGTPREPRDSYAAAFAVGQAAADVATESQNPLRTFTQLRRRGLESLRTETPPRTHRVHTWYNS